MSASTLRRIGACAIALSLASAPAVAQGVKLFKVITAKDEIVIGLSDDELRSLGPRADLDNLAERLAAAGQMTVWQYAVTRAADGSLVQGPRQRVAVFRSDTLRIEPYNPAPLKALPPGQFGTGTR
jgi:hypothetical protein